MRHNHSSPRNSPRRLNNLFPLCLLLLLLVLPLSSLLLLAGCGSGSGSNPSDLTLPLTPTRYEVIDLSEYVASARGDLNNRGDIVGTDGSQKPVLLGSDTLYYLSGDDSPEPLAVNENGQVVGYTRLEQGWTWVEPQPVRRSEENRVYSRAFLWQEGTASDLGILTGSFGSSHARDINDRGEIVGSASIQAYDVRWMPLWRACIWRNGQIQQLPTPDEQASTNAVAINNRGQVAGYGYVTGNNGTIASVMGLLWEGETAAVRELRTADGRAFVPSRSWLLSSSVINEEGVIAGQVILSPGKYAAALLVSSTGELIDLAALSGQPDLAEPVSVNNRGQAVGGDLGNNRGKPYLYSEGKVYFLDQLIDPASGWKMFLVSKINDNGYILAYGNKGQSGRAVLLVPVFE